VSAPTTHDPLFVNTQDGAVWMRRAVTREGRGLYAVADAPKCCPEFVMATLTELAEHGITGSAYALPVPVGPVDAGPVVRPLELPEAQIDALAAAGNRVVNDETHQHLCMCDAWPEKCVSTGNYFMGAWDVDGLEAALPAVLGLWESMRGGELERLQTRVAELLAERHDTNEALLKVTVAQRAAEDRGAELERRLHDAAMTRVWTNEDGKRFVFVEDIAPALLGLEPKPDAITRRNVPLQALREDDVSPQVQKLRNLLAGQRAAVEDGCPRNVIDGDVGGHFFKKGAFADSPVRCTYCGAKRPEPLEDLHDGPLSHSYRVGRDLPEMGGTK
jgi:hypothetical protein